MTEWGRRAMGFNVMSSRLGAAGLALIVLASACGGSGERSTPATTEALATSGADASTSAPAAAEATDEQAAATDEGGSSSDDAAPEAFEIEQIAAGPRDAESSALPPRHLDETAHPESLVPRTEIVSGGPPPDGIPALDDPRFLRASDVDFLADNEPLISVQVGEEVHGYPIQVMTWHELVNDTIGGRAVTVAYCPLCNSAVAFDRTVGDEVLSFGTSGSLHKSALVMYDRQTESLWTHFDGVAVVGELVGTQLDLLPAQTVSWADFLAANPEAPVLSRDTGFDRSYGDNPYAGYDSQSGPYPFAFQQEPDPRGPAMQRIIGIRLDGEATALPTEQAAEAGVSTLDLAGQAVTVWHQPGTSSALDTRRIADGSDVGATGVFLAMAADGTPLDFSVSADGFVDGQTSSTWNIFGEAVSGPLEGEQLVAIEHLDTFWFAWASYVPQTSYLGDA